MTRRPAHHGRGESGAVTVFAIASLALLLLVGSALAVVAGLVRAHRSAQAAADLSALAAATAIGNGGDPCERGRQLAAANGGRLVACTVTGRDVVVEVSVAGPPWLGRAHDLSARARAGPA